MKCPYCGAEVLGTVCEYCDSHMPPEMLQGASAPASRDNKRVLRDFSSTGTYKSERDYGTKDYSSHSSTYAYGDAIRGGNVSRRYRGIALIMCVIVGWLGVHRFYAGRIVTGVIYVFTFGVFGIGPVVDLILLLLGHFKDSEDKLLLDWWPPQMRS